MIPEAPKQPKPNEHRLEPARRRQAEAAVLDALQAHRPALQMMAAASHPTKLSDDARQWLLTHPDTRFEEEAAQLAVAELQAALEQQVERPEAKPAPPPLSWRIDVERRLQICCHALAGRCRSEREVAAALYLQWRGAASQAVAGTMEALASDRLDPSRTMEVTSGRAETGLPPDGGAAADPEHAFVSLPPGWAEAAEVLRAQWREADLRGGPRLGRYVVSVDARARQRADIGPSAAVVGTIKAGTVVQLAATSKLADGTWRGQLQQLSQRRLLYGIPRESTASGWKFAGAWVTIVPGQKQAAQALGNGKPRWRKAVKLVGQLNSTILGMSALSALSEGEGSVGGEECDGAPLVAQILAPQLAWPQALAATVQAVVGWPAFQRDRGGLASLLGEEVDRADAADAAGFSPLHWLALLGGEDRATLGLVRWLLTVGAVATSATQRTRRIWTPHRIEGTAPTELFVDDSSSGSVRIARLGRDRLLQPLQWAAADVDYLSHPRLEPGTHDGGVHGGLGVPAGTTALQLAALVSKYGGRREKMTALMEAVGRPALAAAQRRLLLAEMVVHRRLGRESPAATILAAGAAAVLHCEVEQKWKLGRATMVRSAAMAELSAAEAVVSEKMLDLDATPAHPSAFIKNPARFMAQRELDTVEREAKAVAFRLKKANEKAAGLELVAAAAVGAAENNLTVGAELTTRIAAEIGRRLVGQLYTSARRLHIYRLNEEEDRLEKDGELRRRAAVAAEVQAAEQARIEEEERAAVLASEVEQIRHESTMEKIKVTAETRAMNMAVRIDWARAPGDGVVAPPDAFNSSCMGQARPTTAAGGRSANARC